MPKRVYVRGYLNRKITEQLQNELEIRSKNKFSPPDTKIFHFQRICTLSFCCQVCHRFWSTSYGTCVIRFSIANTFEGPIPSTQVTFFSKFYGQQCNEKHGYASALATKSDANDIVDSFLTAVCDAANGTKKKKSTRKKQQKILKGHKKELCEACQKGIHQFAEQTDSCRAAAQIRRRDSSDDQ